MEQEHQRGRDKACGTIIQTTAQSKVNVMSDHTTLLFGWEASGDYPFPSHSKDDPLQPFQDALAASGGVLAGSVEDNSLELALGDGISTDPNSLWLE